MSGHGHDFDEFLRRVMQEQADAVEPADDGLERIRARLTRPRPVPLVWVMAVFSGAWRRVRGAALSASEWLRTLAAAHRRDSARRVAAGRGGGGVRPCWPPARPSRWSRASSR